VSAPDSDIWYGENGRIELNTREASLRAVSTYSAMFAGVSRRPEKELPDKILAPVFAADSRQFGVILLSSRDARPLATSNRLLLTISGATMGTQAGAMPERPKKLIPYDAYGSWWTLEPDSRFSSKPSGSRDAQVPVWQERVSVKLFFPHAARKMTIYPLDQDGLRMAPLAMSDIVRVQGGFQVRIDSPSPWYELILSGT